MSPSPCPIWTRLHEGQLSVWTDVTPSEVIAGNAGLERFTGIGELKQFPNPASGISYISFKLHTTRQVDLKLYDSSGKEVATLLEKEQLGYGKHIIPVKVKEMKLEPGMYYPRLTADGVIKTLKMIVVE